MTREGYAGITLDEDTLEQLDKVGKRENCRSRPETIRRLIQYYKEIKKLTGEI